MTSPKQATSPENDGRAEVTRIADETELRRTVVVNQRGYDVPDDVANGIAELRDALDLCVSLLSIWRAWTPDYCTAHKDFESLPEVQKARAALAKVRA